MSDTSWIHILVELVKGSDTPTALWQRLLVALWGSLVFHFSLMIVATGIEGPLYTALRNVRWELISMAIPFYSVTFAVIVAVGVERGSLVRFFLYGAWLPAVVYFLAGTILMTVKENSPVVQ